jgi:hypothetical protein
MEYAQDLWSSFVVHHRQNNIEYFGLLRFRSEFSTILHTFLFVVLASILMSFIWVMYNLRIESMLFVFETECFSAIGFDFLIH